MEERSVPPLQEQRFSGYVAGRRLRRVLLVTPYYADHGGGVERVALQLAQGLGVLGWHVVWLASTSIGDRGAENGGRAWIACPVPAWNGVERRTGVPFPIWGCQAIPKLWSMIDRVDVVMVHEALYVPSMLAAFMARVRGKPILLVQHVGAVPYRLAALRAIVAAGNASWTRLVHGFAQRIVYISQGVMDYFEGATSRKKSVLVPNGVDLDCFAPSTDQAGRSERRTAKRILFAGRFVEKKGLDIVEALARRRSELHFALAGEGPLKPAAWNLPNVELLGHLDVEQLAAQYRMASILLLPSHGEGFPLVVQEAMASGLAPLVSTETALALPGVVDHVWCAPVARDTPNLIDLWSDLIDRALAAEQDPARATARAKYAREHWSWQRCIASYDCLLRELLGSEVRA